MARDPIRALSWTTRPRNGVTCDIRQVIAAVSDAGFVHVPAGELAEQYTGRHPWFAATSWWIRFFDYL